MTTDDLHFDAQGLLPAIVQDATSGAVLMLGYMNRESLKKTLATGETHFWSRSRGELWHKGGTSGNVQRVLSIRHDCDADALLVRVDQTGAACHTGEYSCFFGAVQEAKEGIASSSLGEVLGALARVVRQRNLDRPEGSYTTKLLTAGVDKVLKKVGEEAGEVIIAAKNHNPDEINWEVSDLLYHLLVLLEIEGVKLGDVAAILEQRRGQRRRA